MVEHEPPATRVSSCEGELKRFTLVEKRRPYHQLERVNDESGTESKIRSESWPTTLIPQSSVAFAISDRVLSCDRITPTRGDLTVTSKADDPLITFDRRFVIAAIIIGLAYALMISGIGLLLGKETAGVAGVALTALATAVFTKFEDLRFKKSATATIEIPNLGIWPLLLLALSFVGGEYIVGLLIGVGFGSLGIIPNPLTDSVEFSEFLLSPSFFTTALVGKILTYFVLAYCAARSLSRLRYSQVLIAGLLALMFQVLVPILAAAVGSVESAQALLANPATYAMGVVWIVVLAAVLFGTNLGARHSR